MTTYEELMNQFSDEQWDTFESKAIRFNLEALSNYIKAMRMIIASNITGFNSIWQNRLDNEVKRMRQECEKILADKREGVCYICNSTNCTGKSEEHGGLWVCYDCYHGVSMARRAAWAALPNCTCGKVHNVHMIIGKCCERSG